MQGIRVETESLVKRVILEGAAGGCKATGVELADGRIFKAEKEVIVACGAHRTPQLLSATFLYPS